MPTSAKLPEHISINFAADVIAWELVDEYRKTVPIKAIRMDGPFTVETSEGQLACQDGWLCQDSRGYPYPVAATEFANIYEPVEQPEKVVDEQGPPTIVETIEQLQEAIVSRQAEGWGDPRELALALTHLEDVQMRFTRARAKTLGVFRPVDLEKVEAAEERARFENEAKVAAAPNPGAFERVRSALGVPSNGAS
jgi:hypothetical protein